MKKVVKLFYSIDIARVSFTLFNELHRVLLEKEVSENLNVLYCDHSNTSLDSLLSQLNSAHNLTIHLSNINFNITLP